MILTNIHRSLISCCFCILVSCGPTKIEAALPENREPAKSDNSAPADKTQTEPTPNVEQGFVYVRLSDAQRFHFSSGDVKFVAKLIQGGKVVAEKHGQLKSRIVFDSVGPGTTKLSLKLNYVIDYPLIEREFEVKKFNVSILDLSFSDGIKRVDLSGARSQSANICEGTFDDAMRLDAVSRCVAVVDGKFHAATVAADPSWLASDSTKSRFIQKLCRATSSLPFDFSDSVYCSEVSYGATDKLVPDEIKLDMKQRLQTYSDDPLEVIEKTHDQGMECPAVVGLSCAGPLSEYAAFFAKSKRLVVLRYVGKHFGTVVFDTAISLKAE